LVEDWRRPGSVVNVNRNPFCLIQTETPKVADFRVGASEMRLVEFTSDAPVAAHVEGTVTFNEQGMIEADVRCDSDHAIHNPFVWVNGAKCNLVANQEADGTHYRTNSPQFPMPAAAHSGGTGAPMGMARYGNEPLKPDLPSFRDSYVVRLFSAKGTGGVYAEQDIQMNSTIGPVFGGWIQGANLTQVRADRPLENATSETLLLADVSVGADSRTGLSVMPLGIWPDNVAVAYGNGQFALALGATGRCYVGIPQEILDSETGEILVSLISFALPEGGYQLALDGDGRPVQAERVEDGQRGDLIHVFHVAEWRERLVDPAALGIDVEELQRRAQMQGAMAMQAQRGGRGVVSMPKPPAVLGEPVKYLTLALTAPPSPDWRVAGQPVDVFSLGAEVVVLETVRDSKEDLPWH
jgi:hypothetical protein